MKQLAYLNKFFWKYRWRLSLGILFVGLATWFRVLQPKFIGKALDEVVQQTTYYKEHGGIDAHPEAFSELGTKIAWYGAMVIGLALLMGLFMFFMRQTIIVVSRLIEYDMRKELFAHYEKLDLAFYKRNSTGDLMSRISEDVSKVRMFLGPTILYGLDLIFLFVLTISAMLNVSLELTLWSLLPLPFLSISIYWVSTLINRRSEKIQQQLAVLTSTAQEVYSGIRVVKSYGQEKAMGRWFAEQSEEFRQKSLKLVRIDSFFFPLMALMIGASTIITVFVGGMLVVQTAGLPPGDPGKVTAGNIAEFVIYINMLTWPVTAIGWIASLTQQAAASQKRINEFLGTKPAIDPTPGPSPAGRGETLPPASVEVPGVKAPLPVGESPSRGSGRPGVGSHHLTLYNYENQRLIPFHRSFSPPFPLRSEQRGHHPVRGKSQHAPHPAARRGGHESHDPGVPDASERTAVQRHRKPVPQRGGRGRRGACTERGRSDPPATPGNHCLPEFQYRTESRVPGVFR